MTPGITVDRNAAPTEIPPVTAKTIIGIEGGIISARTDEQATSAVAWPAGYPSLIMRGIMIWPIAAMAADDEPEIAPNSAQVTTVTAPSPPLSRPMKALTKARRRSEIPPCAISVPAMTNRGKASRAKLEVVW